MPNLTTRGIALASRRPWTIAGSVQIHELVLTRQYNSSTSKLINNSQRRDTQISTGATLPVEHSVSPPTTKSVEQGPLARVTTSHLVRSLFLAKVCSSPKLLAFALGISKRIVDSKSSFLDPDKNFILGNIVRTLFYNQFCAGTAPTEVRKNVQKIKDSGFSGVILGFHREILLENPEEKNVGEDAQKVDQKAVDEWLQGNLDTLSLIGRGDYMNVKYTGAGSAIGELLIAGKPMPNELKDALDIMCKKAEAQGSCIWIDAEQQLYQNTIDDWTIELMRQYNTGSKALIYNTFQAYLKGTRKNIERHLELAKADGWVLGIKLVRGAYITTDIRSRIWDTKQQTDDNYNSIVRDVVSKSFSPYDRSSMPPVDLFIAGHNKESIRLARQVVSELVAEGKELRPVAYGQLQGMADEVSYALVQQRKAVKDSAVDMSEEDSQRALSTAPRPYKCLAWGSLKDCMSFLMRRAVENATALDRLQDGITETKMELKRRFLPWTRA